jgi:RNA recognition motif-containing protein
MGKSKNLVLVGDIPKEATESDLKSLFSQYGQIKKIYFHDFPDYLTSPNLNNLQKLVQKMKESKSQPKKSGVLGHYCLVSFSRRESVEKCIYANVNFGT